MTAEPTLSIIPLPDGPFFLIIGPELGFDSDEILDDINKFLRDDCGRTDYRIISGATAGTCPVIAPFTIEMGPLEPLPDNPSDMVCRLRVLRLDENGRPVYGTPTGETP